MSRFVDPDPELHDRSNGTYDVGTLLAARIAALRMAIQEESGLLLAAQQMIGAAGLGMSTRQADEQRHRALARAAVLERWLLRPPDEDEA